MIERAFAPAAEAVASARIPGATLGVVAADGRRWVTHTGMAALVPEPEPLTLDHWFDLASVSKVVATTTMILRLADEGRIDLDAQHRPCPFRKLRGQAALRRFRGETDARAGTLRAGTSLLDGVSRVARI